MSEQHNHINGDIGDFAHVGRSVIGPGIRDQFHTYLLEEVGSSGRGTISTYIRALDVLSIALSNSKSSYSHLADIWTIQSPSDLLKLQVFVLDEQRKFVRGQASIFSSIHSGGMSYFKNRWCSAAVRHLAAFRQKYIYGKTLFNILESSDNGAEIARLAGKVRFENAVCAIPENVDPHSKEGLDAIRSAKQRIGQSVFRSWIVDLYGGKCCVTGLNIPEVLRASHIKSWAEDRENRLNPCNGICLSATYDAAFDKHLISFDSDYRLVLSKRLRDFFSNPACVDYFGKFEGRRISLPQKFLPVQSFLAAHRERLVS